MAGTITYSKKTRVHIELTEGEIEAALRAYVAHMITVPDDAQLDFDISQGALVKGATVWWDESEDTTEEIV